ncbi:MAG: TIGR03986 family CRISPR-associated RAMP protein [Bacillota bacterium]
MAANDNNAGASAGWFLNPYNFVRSLPPAESGFLAKQPPASHAYYEQGNLTGQLNCTLTAITPVFISSSEPIRVSEGHPTYQFFEIDGQPVIPASSLRGMIRNTYEAVTNSCYSILDERQLSRRMTTNEGKDMVPARVIEGPNGLRLSLLQGRADPNFRNLQPAAWVRRYDPPNRRRPSRSRVDMKGLQHGDECWGVLKPMPHGKRPFSFWNVEALFTTRSEAEQHARHSPALRGNRNVIVERGYLCITGQNMENKHDGCFFFGQERMVHLTEELMKGYETIVRDYLDLNETKLAAKGDELPEPSRFMRRPNPDKLKAGDLVYAGIENGQVAFLVPVQLSRRMFPNSIGELIPQRLRSCNEYNHLCPACRLFGWVRGETSEGDGARAAYAGRVAFSYGRLKDPPKAKDEEQHTLAELSSPKPTTTFFYLKTQDGSAPYISKEDGYQAESQEIRGRKFYRHHSDFRWQEGEPTIRNRTIRDPVPPGTEFTFTIRFHNLTEEELGALVWALELECGMYHRLGFGKPLGLGSVQIKIDHAIKYNLQDRYASLENDGAGELDLDHYISLFKQKMSDTYGTDFMELEPVVDLKAILSEHPDGLPVRYPAPPNNPKGENFRWFMEAQRQRKALSLAHEDKGLPPLG